MSLARVVSDGIAEPHEHAARGAAEAGGGRGAKLIQGVQLGFRYVAALPRRGLPAGVRDVDVRRDRCLNRCGGRRHRLLDPEVVRVGRAERGLVLVRRHRELRVGLRRQDIVHDRGDVVPHVVERGAHAARRVRQEHDVRLRRDPGRDLTAVEGLAATCGRNAIAAYRRDDRGVDLDRRVERRAREERIVARVRHFHQPDLAGEGAESGRRGEECAQRARKAGVVRDRQAPRDADISARHDGPLAVELDEPEQAVGRRGRLSDVVRVVRLQGVRVRRETVSRARDDVPLAGRDAGGGTHVPRRSTGGRRRGVELAEEIREVARGEERRGVVPRPAARVEIHHIMVVGDELAAGLVIRPARAAVGLRQTGVIGRRPKLEAEGVGHLHGGEGTAHRRRGRCVGDEPNP